MKDSTFPPRLSASDDAAVGEILRFAKEDAMPAADAARSFAAFEATKFAGVGRAGDVALPVVGSRWGLPIKTVGALAVACAIGFGWRALGPMPEASVLPRPATSAASGSTAFAPDAVEEATTRVEDLPSEPALPFARRTDGILATNPTAQTTNGRLAAASDARAGAKVTGIRSSLATAAGIKNAETKPTAEGVGATSTMSSDSLDSLAAETAAIENARTALASGRPAETLRITQQYEARFPSPLFRQEALAVRIEALAGLGRNREAAALAASFFRSYPESLYKSRIRSVVKESE